MAESNIVVPPEMLEAASVGYCEYMDLSVSHRGLEAALKCALFWLSENPIVPTSAQANSLIQEGVNSGALREGDTPALSTVKSFIKVWQRRMFLAPETKAS